MRETALIRLSTLSWSKPSTLGTTTQRKKTKQLETIQRWAARWTFSIIYDYRLSVTAMPDQLDWRTLEQTQADACICLLYKIALGLVAVTLPDYIQPTHRVSQWLLARSKQLGIIINIYSFHWHKYSGMPNLRLLPACKTMIHSSSRLVSCSTKDPRSRHCCFPSDFKLHFTTLTFIFFYFLHYFAFIISFQLIIYLVLLDSAHLPKMSVRASGSIRRYMIYLSIFWFWPWNLISLFNPLNISYTPTS